MRRRAKWVTRIVACIGVCALALVTSACLKKDMTSTWYVDQAQGVVWTVLEKDVRSAADTAAERQRDEDLFVTEVRQQNQPVARGLRQLGPTSLRTKLLRDKAPFSATTDAEFVSLRVLGERLLARLGLQGYSSVEMTTEGHQWTWHIDAGSMVPEDLVDEDLTALFESEVIRVALQDGQFLDTEGVELSDDRRIATFPVVELIDDKGRADGRPTVFVLKWKEQ